MSSMLDSLVEQRAALAAEASALLDGEPTSEALETVEARQSDIAALDEQITKVEATEARAAAINAAKADAGAAMTGSAIVTNEARTYSPEGERSFVRDMINAHLRNDRNAWDGLHRHMQEERAVSRTDTTSAGELVPPLWLVDMYSKTLRPGRTTADLLVKQALPAGTDSINIPKITTGSDVGIQTADNAATTTQDLVTGSIEAPVRTISGYSDVAIQLVDQSPLAGGLDRLLFGDLMAAYDYKLDYQVLQGVGTAGQMYGLINTTGINAGTYTSGTPTAAGIGTAIVQAISTIAKNRYKGAEAIVMHPSIWYFLVGQTDSSGRPLVVPTSNGPWNSAGVVTEAGGAQGSVGTFMGLPVYADSAIAVGANSELPIVVASFSDNILMESGIRTRVLPDVGSASLTVRFQVYGYTAMAARYPTGIAKIVGTGLVPAAGF